MILRSGTPATANVPFAFDGRAQGAHRAVAGSPGFSQVPATSPLAETAPNSVGGAPASFRTRSMSGASKLKTTFALGSGVQ